MHKRRNNGRFAKGASGNPTGRPKGRRNNATLLQEQLLGIDGELIIQKAVELAKQGNIPAIKVCLERLIPPAKERCIEIALKSVTNNEELPFTVADVLGAIGRGEITPAEGQQIATTIATHLNVVRECRVLRQAKKMQRYFDEQRRRRERESPYSALSDAELALMYQELKEESQRMTQSRSARTRVPDMPPTSVADNMEDESRSLTTPVRAVPQESLEASDPDADE